MDFIIFIRFAAQRRNCLLYTSTDLLRLLLFKLPLAVDGPAQQPLRVLTADNTAGDHLAGTGIPLADVFDIRQDLVIQSGDSGRLPVGLGHIGTELLRTAKSRVLLSNVCLLYTSRCV